MLNLGLAAVMAVSAGIVRADGNPANLVTVTGEIRPEFRIEIPADELARITESFRSLRNPEPITVDVNSLFSGQDGPALRKAMTIIATKMTETVSKLAEMKALVYRAAAVSQLDQGRGFTNAIFQRAQRALQERYNGMVGGLADFRLQAAMNECRSEVCSIMIADAQRDLLGLAEQMNTGIRFNRLNRMSFSFQFQSRLAKATLEEVYRGLIPANQDLSSVNVVGAAILSPFVLAARQGHNIGDFLAQNICSGVVGRVVRSSLDVEPADIDFEQYGRHLREVLSHRLQNLLTRTPTAALDGMPARNRNLTLLSCKAPVNRGFIGAAVYGVQQLHCTNLLASEPERTLHIVNIRTVGAALGIDGDNIAFIAIVHLAETTPDGLYFGVSASAHLMGGVGAHIFTSGNSTATIFQVGVGMSVRAGISSLWIGQAGDMSQMQGDW